MMMVVGVGDILPEIATKSQISFSIAGRHSQVSQGTPDHLTILQIRTSDATDAGDTKLRPFFVKQKVKDKLKMFLSFGLSINSLYFRVMTTYDDSVMSEKAKYKDKFLFITVLK